jgi:hypothetical protein
MPIDNAELTYMRTHLRSISDTLDKLQLAYDKEMLCGMLRDARDDAKSVAEVLQILIEKLKSE